MNSILQWAHALLNSYSPRDFLLNPSLEEWAHRLNYTRDMR